MRAFRDLLIDYAQNSSINGLPYLFATRRHWTEYLWWTVAMVLAIAGSSCMIVELYDKWQERPVIVTISERFTPIWDVPFPAVTVCSETKARPEELNYAHLLRTLAAGTVDQLTHKQRRQALALQQICTVKRLNRPLNTTDSVDDIVQLLREMAPKIEESIWGCGLRDIAIAEASEMFSEVLTSEGVCHTFNMLSPQEMYREGISTDFLTSGAHGVNGTWTLDGETMAYPVRLIGGGEPLGLKIFMQLPSIGWLCRGAMQGYRVLIHAPDEQPRVSHHFLQLAQNSNLMVAVRPRIIETTERLRNYAPSLRQCFFPMERPLQFYKVYKQRNCELECLTNFTLKQCGCVMFSMPRSQNTPLCNNSQLRCVREAEHDIQEQDYHDTLTGISPESGCNCLADCTSISYDLEISESSIFYRELYAKQYFSDEIWPKELTIMSVFYKQDQFYSLRRSELFGSTDFLARCGDMISLFMGISVLSIVEMVYYCSLRFACNSRNHRDYSM